MDKNIDFITLAVRARLCLEQGENLSPLADMLKHPSQNIDPAVKTLLLKMIEGNEQETDYVLRMTKNPTFKHKKHLHSEKRKKAHKGIDVAIWLLRNGIDEKGMFDSVAKEAIDHFGISYGTVTGHLSKWRDHAEKLVTQMDDELNRED